MAEIRPFLPDALHGWAKRYATSQGIGLDKLIIQLLEAKREEVDQDERDR